MAAAGFTGELLPSPSTEPPSTELPAEPPSPTAEPPSPTAESPSPTAEPPSPTAEPPSPTAEPPSPTAGPTGAPTAVLSSNDQQMNEKLLIAMQSLSVAMSKHYSNGTNKSKFDDLLQKIKTNKLSDKTTQERFAKDMDSIMRTKSATDVRNIVKILKQVNLDQVTGTGIILSTANIQKYEEGLASVGMDKYVYDEPMKMPDSISASDSSGVPEGKSTAQSEERRDTTVDDGKRGTGGEKEEEDVVDVRRKKITEQINNFYDTSAIPKAQRQANARNILSMIRKIGDKKLDNEIKDLLEGDQVSRFQDMLDMEKEDGRLAKKEQQVKYGLLGDDGKYKSILKLKKISADEAELKVQVDPNGEITAEKIPNDGNPGIVLANFSKNTPSTVNDKDDFVILSEIDNPSSTTSIQGKVYNLGVSTGAGFGTPTYHYYATKGGHADRMGAKINLNVDNVKENTLYKITSLVASSSSVGGSRSRGFRQRSFRKLTKKQLNRLIKLRRSKKRRSYDY
jgi:hypothetical protein